MSDSVTISLLPVSLALVHLPRSRLAGLTQHILRQILKPNPTFLNLTCNEIELSLFTEHHSLHHFEKIAKRDARKHHAAQHPDAYQQDPRRVRRKREDWEPIEVSADKWSVLQIDSHSDQLESGARVRELSAPLAAAGISILYQSSYMSDFIFVKSTRLSQVMTLLASAGFDLYYDNPDNLTAQLSTFTSPLVSPTAEDDTPITLLELNPNPLTSSANQRVDTEGSVIFTRSRSSTNTTSSLSSSCGASVFSMSSPADFSLSPDIPLTGSGESDQQATPAPPAKPALGRGHSHSPSVCDVTVLAPDLTFVGLSDDNAETWSLKIIKLVAFPDLIVGNRHTGGAKPRRYSPSDGIRSHPLVVTSLYPSEGGPLRIITENDNTSGSDTTTRVGLESPKEEVVTYEHADIPLIEARGELVWGLDAEDSSDTDDVLSHPSQEDSEQIDTDTEEMHPSQRSSSGKPSLSHQDTMDTVDTAETAQPSRRGSDGSRRRSRSASSSSSVSSSSARSSSHPLVPFFSFTRTCEGSSLTAPVSLLSALFPPSERHMVICSDELDISDSREASPDEDPSEDDADDEGMREAQGPLRCLQIDLRKFGLDKHGLVNRFSRALEENGINHMYNSTYKTANLLVDKAHASRAQALLRSC